METTNKKQEDDELKKKKEKSKTIRNIRNLIIKIIMLIITYLIVLGLIFGLKRMDTSFMSPKITEGDLLVFYRIDRNFEIEDVILFENRGKQYVMRIVAKEGQTVDISEDGKLLIDGYPEEHQAFFETDKDETSQIKFPYRVESGKYFVMNDYRLNKSDSRLFGTISRESIKGKIIGRLQVRNI